MASPGRGHPVVVGADQCEVVDMGLVALGMHGGPLIHKKQNPAGAAGLAVIAKTERYG